MTGVKLDRLDHFVLTVRDIEATCGFYETALGMRRESFDGDTVSLHFGRQKINLHPYPSPVEILAKDPSTAHRNSRPPTTPFRGFRLGARCAVAPTRHKRRATMSGSL